MWFLYVGSRVVKPDCPHPRWENTPTLNQVPLPVDIIAKKHLTLKYVSLIEHGFIQITAQ